MFDQAMGDYMLFVEKDAVSQVIALVLLSITFAVTLTVSIYGRTSRNKQRRVDRICIQAHQKTKVNVSFKVTARRQAAPSVFGSAASSVLRHLPMMNFIQEHTDRAGLRINPVDVYAIVITIGVLLASLFNFIWHLTWALTLTVGVLVATSMLSVSINWLIASRKKKFVKDFPDAIDLIIRSLRSGLPLTEAIVIVGREARGCTAEVFQEITGNLALGISLDKSLWMSTARVAAQEYRFFVVSITIQQETGGNITEVLQNLANIIRRREQLRLKIKAMSSEARASAAIIGSLPILMFILIWFINNEYMMKFFIDPRGPFVLATGAGSLVVGVLTMVKLTNFKF